MESIRNNPSLHIRCVCTACSALAVYLRCETPAALRSSRGGFSNRSRQMGVSVFGPIAKGGKARSVYRSRGRIIDVCVCVCVSRRLPAAKRCSQSLSWLGHLIALPATVYDEHGGLHTFIVLVGRYKSTLLKHP